VEEKEEGEIEREGAGEDSDYFGGVSSTINPLGYTSSGSSEGGRVGRGEGRVGGQEEDGEDFAWPFAGAGREEEQESEEEEGEERRRRKNGQMRQVQQQQQHEEQEKGQEKKEEEEEEEVGDGAPLFPMFSGHSQHDEEEEEEEGEAGATRVEDAEVEKLLPSSRAVRRKEKNTRINPADSASSSSSSSSASSSTASSTSTCSTGATTAPLPPLACPPPPPPTRRQSTAKDQCKDDRDEGEEEEEEEEEEEGDEECGVLVEDTTLPELYPPGRMVHIFSSRGVYRACMPPRDFVGLRRISLQGNLLNDHTPSSYFAALCEVIDVRKAPIPPPEWEGFSDKEACACCAVDLTWQGGAASEAQRDREKHNCRCCGQLVCDSCSGHRMALPSIGLSLPARVCDRCFFGGKQSATTV